MQGKPGTTTFATCLGCSRREPIWKVQGRNITLDPLTLTFRHRSRECRDVRIQVSCSDRRSPKCRGAWLEYPSLFLRVRRRQGAPSAPVAGGQYFHRCGPCSNRRNAAKARARLSGARAALPLSKEYQVYAARRPRPRRYRSAVLSGSGRQSFMLCLLCDLAISGSVAGKVWSVGAFHRPCWRTWLRFSGQSPAPKAESGRFRSTRHTPRDWRHRGHLFKPPPPMARAGRRVACSTLSLGYAALLRRAAGALLKEIGDGRDVTPQNIAEARVQYLRNVPGTWGLVFGSDRSHGNLARQELCELSAAVQREGDGPRRTAIVRRLLGFGMEPPTIAELVAWPLERVVLEAAKVVVVPKDPQVAARQQGRRAARRLMTGDRRRGNYHARRMRQLCVDCARPAISGRSRCTSHLRAVAVRQLKHKDDLNGIPACRWCRIPFGMGERQHGLRYHAKCIAEKERERRATQRLRLLPRVESALGSSAIRIWGYA